MLLYVLLLLAVGIVIGWNWPQPPWARDFQARVVDTVRSLTGKAR
ncbi:MULTISPECIES: hypothetical protein [Marichromatium]|nr:MULTISPECIES: hypothetical protein [Marichromatium]